MKCSQSSITPFFTLKLSQPKENMAYLHLGHWFCYVRVCEAYTTGSLVQSERLLNTYLLPTSQDKKTDPAAEGR